MSLSAPPDPGRHKPGVWSQEAYRPHRAERRRQQKRHRRTVVARVLAAGVVVAVGATLFVAFQSSGTSPPTPKSSGAVVPGPADPVLAWGVRVGSNSFVTVFSEPRGSIPTAVVIPGDTTVDVPSGPSTVGGTIERTGLLVAAVQATLERRVEHAAVTDEAGIVMLVNAAGGVTVDLDQPVESGGTTVGPGPTRLNGEQVAAYLGEGSEDAVLRWEDVVDVLVESVPASVWSAAVPAGEDSAAVASLLSGAKGADVLELPTTVTGLGRTKDPGGVRELVSGAFPAAAPPVKTIVLDGAGIQGAATDVVARVSPAGFWVVAVQNMRRFNHEETQVVAGDESFLDDATRVASLLGVGRVYVGGQPTGVAEVTIVVGKDYVHA